MLKSPLTSVPKPYRWSGWDGCHWKYGITSCSRLSNKRWFYGCHMVAQSPRSCQVGDFFFLVDLFVREIWDKNKKCILRRSVSLSIIWILFQHYRVLDTSQNILQYVVDTQIVKFTLFCYSAHSSRDIIIVVVLFYVRKKIGPTLTSQNDRTKNLIAYLSGTLDIAFWVSCTDRRRGLWNTSGWSKLNHFWYSNIILMVVQTSHFGLVRW